jgi:hypothetical protein
MNHKSRFGVTGGSGWLIANPVHDQPASWLVVIDSEASFDARVGRAVVLDITTISEWVRAFPTDALLVVSGGADPGQVVCLWKEFDGGVKEDITSPGESPTSLSIRLVAAMTIPGHRAVMTDVNGRGVLVDPNAPTYTYVGIARTAANVGSSFDAVVFGSITSDLWNWSPGLPVFPIANGRLTQTPPTSGILHIIGIAVSPTMIILNAAPPTRRVS